MYEFVLGLFFGAAGALLRRPTKETADKSIQVWAIPTPSIPIRNSFVPGSLKNFWGPDSPCTQ